MGYKKYGQCITPGCKSRGAVRGYCKNCYQKVMYRRMKNNV